MILRATRRWPGDLQVSVTQVKVLDQVGGSERALSLARRLAQTSPRTQTFLLWAGVAGRQRPGSEIPILEKARRQSSDHHLSFALARAYLRQGRMKRAIELATELSKQGRTAKIRASAHELLAKIFKMDGRHHRAKWEVEEARRIRSLFDEVKKNKGLRK